MNNSLIDEKQLQELWGNPNLIILDVSPPSNIAMFTASHPELMIEGAFLVNFKKELGVMNSPYPNTFPTKEIFDSFAKSIGLSENSIVVVYDNLGIYTSPRVWWILKSMGFHNVSVLNGGLASWIKAKGETENRTNIERPNNGTFAGIPDHTAVVTFEQIEQNIEKASFKIVDARSSGRFRGESPEPRNHLKSGSIKDSVNIPFKEVLVNGKLKPKQELKQIFRSFESQKLVFSCGSGITACILRLAADQVLENEMSVYDGSWTEWAEKQKLYVE